MGSWDDWLTFHPFHFSDGPVLSVEVGWGGVCLEVFWLKPDFHRCYLP